MTSILSPVYYNIWDIIQQRVYQTKVHDVNDLKQSLIAVIFIDETSEQWHRRLQACIQAKRGHFEYLL